MLLIIIKNNVKVAHRTLNNYNLYKFIHTNIFLFNSLLIIETVYFWNILFFKWLGIYVNKKGIYKLCNR